MVENNSNLKVTPVPVKAISIYIILLSVLGIISVHLYLPWFGFSKLLEIYFTVMLIIQSFVAIMLWKGKAWARVLVIIFEILGVLTNLGPLAIMSSYLLTFKERTNFFIFVTLILLLLLIISIIIIIYLLFNKNAKEYFS